MQDASIASATEVRQFLTSVMRGEPTEQVPLFVDKGLQELTDAKPGMSVRVKAAELLGRVMGLFSDQVSVSVSQMPRLIVNADGSAFKDDPQ